MADSVAVAFVVVFVTSVACKLTTVVRLYRKYYVNHYSICTYESYLP